MLRYVDSVILIYYLDRADSFHQRAKAWLATMLAQGDDLAVSDLSRLECRVGPIKRSDDVALALFDGFFQRSDVRTVPLTTGVFDRATRVRATFISRPRTLSTWQPRWRVGAVHSLPTTAT